MARKAADSKNAVERVEKNIIATMNEPLGPVHRLVGSVEVKVGQVGVYVNKEICLKSLGNNAFPHCHSWLVVAKDIRFPFLRKSRSLSI